VQVPQVSNIAGSSQSQNSQEICRQLHLAVVAQNQAVGLQLKKAALVSHAGGTKARCDDLMNALADDERVLPKVSTCAPKCRAGWSDVHAIMFLQLEQDLEAAKRQDGPDDVLAAMQRVMELQHTLAATALEAHQAGMEQLAAQQQACVDSAELEKCQVRSHTANCIARLLREVDEASAPACPTVCAPPRAPLCAAPLTHQGIAGFQRGPAKRAAAVGRCTSARRADLAAAAVGQRSRRAAAAADDGA
jgi:hypothetical protein